MPRVTGPLDTTAPEDTFPTHDSRLGLGGWSEQADATARNAIPDDRRRQGMVVVTLDDDKKWELNASPWDGTGGDWTELGFGGGGVDTNRLLPAGGTVNQVLTKDSGTDYDTSWTTVSGGGGEVTPFSLEVKTANFTLTDANDAVLFDTASGALTATLHSAVTALPKPYTITLIGANALTIATTSSQTINGDLTQLLWLKGTSLTLVPDGANWHII